MKRLGFIGAGNMGGAILSGLLRKGCLTADQVMVSDKAEGQLSRYAQLYPGLATTTDNRQVAKESQMILLAVKPQFLRDVLAEIRDELKGKAVISIAAGWTQAMLNQVLEGTGATVLRAIEIEAEAILLAKAVDGIYDSDPKTNPDAKKYQEISIDEVIARKLAAVDMTASIMCMENKMPMLVFALEEENSIVNTINGNFTGTKVTV